jgi:glycopeptide antibiotics resistance protein
MKVAREVWCATGQFGRAGITRERRALESKNKILAYLPFVYLLIIIYCSFIPFDYRPVSLPEAWSRFLAIPYLKLGVASRADWIANILLYIPLGFLSTACLMDAVRSPGAKVLFVLVALHVCFFIAAGIEFLQIFFAPRTVSLNDIMAEVLGAAGGIALWCIAGRRLARLWRSVFAGGRRAVDAALALYVLVYLAISLFPFDFPVSLSELSWKLTTDQYSFVITRGASNHLLRCLVILMVEIITTVPFGVLIAIRSGDRRRHKFYAALIYGGAFGLTMEVLQFFTASGVTQGASVLTRVIGIGLGFWLLPIIRGGRLSALRPFLKTGIVFATMPYFLLLMALNDWFSQRWVNVGKAFFKLNRKMFIPFYYHYFTTETMAMASLLFNVVMYIPIGLGYWAWHHSRKSSSGSPVIAGLFGCAAAGVIEGGKLFLANKHPDFTNLLIAAAAAWAAYSVAVWISRMSSGSHSAECIEPLVGELTVCLGNSTTVSEAN